VKIIKNLLDNVLSVASATNQEVITENANKSAFLFSTQRDLIAGEVAKHLAKIHFFDSDLVQAHEDGLIHIHDLDYFPLTPMTNCSLVNLRDMLANGFKMNGITIETPTNINTAMTLASQIVMAVGSCQYGGISFDRLDEVMQDYVEKSYYKYLKEAPVLGIPDEQGYAEKKVRKATYDACQTFEYQVNSMTCTSGQTPFLTVGIGLSTSWFGQLFQEMMLKVRIEGIGKERVTPIFPKMLFTQKEGVNLTPEDPCYHLKQLAVECSSKRLYPDVLNYEQIEKVTGSFKASMG